MDQKRRTREEMDELLREGMQSEASEMTRTDWDELHRRVLERESSLSQRLFTLKALHPTAQGRAAHPG